MCPASKGALLGRFFQYPRFLTEDILILSWIRWGSSRQALAVPFVYLSLSVLIMLALVTTDLEQEAAGNDISEKLKYAALHDCMSHWRTCGAPKFVKRMHKIDK